MSRKKPNLVFIVWDIGKGSRKIDADGKSLLEKQKECINLIIGNKVMFETIDQVGLLKFNSDLTSHPGDHETFPNIHLQCDFDSEKLETIKAVEQTQSTELENEFLGALCVAIQAIMRNKKANTTAKGDPFASIKLILVSNLDSGAYNNVETKTITKHIKNLGCTLFVIGPAVEIVMDNDSKQENLNYFQQCPESFDAVTAARLMFKHVDGIHWNLDEAIWNNMCVTSRKVTPRNSKILLELGTHLKIKVGYFNEIQEESRLEFKVLNDKDMTRKTGYDKVYTTKGGKRPMVDEEDIIPGYKFGTSIVPIPNEDKEALTYKSGLPCLKILGFSKQKYLPPIMYVGKTSVNIFPQPTDKESMIAFSSLVRAMHTRKSVAIVRRVTTNNGRLQLGALIPRVFDAIERLIFVELPFAEDVVAYKFPRINPVVSQDQLDVAHELVNLMDLMTAHADGGEAFEVRSCPNPAKIYTNQEVLRRACYPDAPLQPPSDKVRSILEPPATILEAAEKIDAKLKAAFSIAEKSAKQLKAARVKTPRASTSYGAPRAMDVDLLDDSLQQAAQTSSAGPQAVRTVQIGSVTPAEDFQELIRQGVPLENVCKQCQTIVLQLAVRSQNDFHKPLAAIRVMRVECVKSNPAFYNDWLPQLRAELADRDQLGLWLCIMNDALGPITKEENPEANVDKAEALKFLAEPPPESQSQKMDIDDLLFDM